jgi:hypothetical protein
MTKELILRPMGTKMPIQSAIAQTRNNHASSAAFEPPAMAMA